MADKRIKDLTNTATEADLVSGNYFALDGSAGTKKLNSTTLLTKTAQNALASNVVQAFDPTRDEDHKYLAGKDVVAYNGKVYVFKNDHYGAWASGDVVAIEMFSDLITEGSFAIENNRYCSSSAVELSYSNVYDTLMYIPVKAGDILHINVGEIGCRVLVRQPDLTSYDYFAFTTNVERTVTIAPIAGKEAKWLYVPVSKKYRKNCFVEINGKRVFDGAANGSADIKTDILNSALQNLYFVGNDNTYAQKYFFNKFAPGKRYRLNLLTSGADYEDTGSSTSVYKFYARALNADGTDNAELIKVYQGSVVNKVYEFTMPLNCCSVRFGGRIAFGKIVIAIPEEVEAKDYLTESVLRKKVALSMNFENSTVNNGYPAHDGALNRVCSKDIIIWPHANGKYRFVAPGDVQFSAGVFNAQQALFATIDWTSDGTEFSVNSDVNNYGGYAFRISFRRSDNSNISVAEVLQYIDSGLLYIEDLTEENIEYLNHPSASAVASAKKKLIGERPWCKDLPIFAHISDLHGDVARHHNARKIAEAFGVDALVNSGDAVMYMGTAGATFVGDDASEAIPEIFCIGNHEAYPTGDSQLFSKFIQPLVIANGYEKASGTAADDCYYFRDIPAKKIRFVVLNYYNGGVYAGSLGQTQLEWFVNTLAGTPEGYGVVVVIHSPEDKIVCPEELQTFYQKERVVSYQENGFYIGDRPVMNIVDSFISGTAGTESYTDGETAVSISYDFTDLADDVEFICYMCGHRHEDWIGYYDHATNKQLSLGIVTGNAINSMFVNTAWNNQSDLGRNDGRGTPQDAVNIYAIDRDSGVVRVVRVGANVTTSLAKREMLIIPYKDN